MRRTLVVAMALPLLLLGCAGLTERTAPVTVEERLAYDEARAQLEADPAAGERQHEAFLSTHPGSGLAAEAALALGESRRARGDDEGALRAFRTALEKRPRNEVADLARLGVAELELARGDIAAATTAIRPLRMSRLPAERRPAAYRVLADTATEPVAKLRWLAQLRRATQGDDAIALVDVEIDELLLRLPARDLQRAADQVEPEIPAARILLASAMLALDAGDVQGAQEDFERARELALAPSYAPRLESVRERLDQRSAGARRLGDVPTFSDLGATSGPATVGAVGTLGVVLPLSGQFGRFGEESLQGVMLAAGIYDAERPPEGRAAVRVLIRDSAGRPERAAQAVRDLAREEGVAAIVGPLLSGECEAAAAAAEEEGIPLLALTARQEVARDRSHVFRIRTEPVEETETLVEHAMGDLGARRFAILYPRDRYGRGLRRLFWDAVERRGGEVVGVASYDPEATDFGDSIRQLVGYTLLTDAEKKAIKEREKLMTRARRMPPEKARELRDEALEITGPNGAPLPPIVDFDAIFIPESHEKVVLIAPQLAYHEATGVHLLGPNGWYSEDLVPLAREHVEGAHFTAHFYPESELPFVRDFAGRYEATFDTVPDALAAQAYDAANLVLKELARGRSERDDVRDGVLRTRGYPGVSGVLSMRPDGNATKRPYLLGVEKGRIIQLD